MRDYPALPSVADAPAVVDSGHLWIYEYLDAAPFRFAPTEAGYLVFGTDDRAFGDEVPLAFRHAARHVRERIDWGELQSVTDSAGRPTFVGLATRRQGVDYDWDRLPPFLGYEVWVADDERFVTPDVAEKVFEGVGLASANTLVRELQARDFGAGRYEFPASAWYDGPVAGVVVRNKHGGRALLSNPAVGDRPDPPGAVDADELLGETLPPTLIDRVIDGLGDDYPTLDAVLDRTLEALARESYATVYRGDDPAVPPGDLRSALVGRVRRALDER